ncbi:ATP-dependent metallopeptidase Hfl [Hesseltinella vesiculosa]|uniref:ATP-dependent metallopeptidase Hfl n=1 Tax=Hesseltinella vesiculosa TaxID=101127 RepID=A0A1X2GP80_9FUNG|nr:ATP-dependent metallopeptidase Hfl [Hesseltinella vesiculosa]
MNHLGRDRIKHILLSRSMSIHLLWPKPNPFQSPKPILRYPQRHMASLRSPPRNWQYLSKLENDANAHPNDAQLQALLYKELRLARRPKDVIRRFENSNCVRDTESYRHYVAALVEAGQESRVMPELLKHWQGKSAQELSSAAKAEPVYVVVEETRGLMLWRAVQWLGAAFVYTFCLLTILSLAMENSGLLKTTSTSPPEYEPSNQQPVTFDDVQGCDEAKEELEELVQFLKNPHRYTELGGHLPKGVLLTGPPGTGKTLLARAVAGEAQVPFFFMSGSEFDEMYVGVGAKRIRDLFAAARQKSPSIVFIDELDAIGAKRNPKDSSYMKQTLNQLLVDLDGFSQTEGVIFIAATNFPELLDKALVRPGRFDRTIHVPLPDVRGRKQILEQHLKSVALDPTVDVAVIARGTPGLSGAEIANLVNQAAIQASRDGAKQVTLQHLEAAKDKIIMGAERKSAVISDESKRLTAYHEGGHTLVAYFTDGAMPLLKCTIIPRGSALGVTVQLPEMDKYSFSRKEFLAQIDVCMGGRVAEEMVFGKENITSGAHSDIVKATDIAKRMVRHYGMSDRAGPVSVDDDDLLQLSTETKRLLENEIKDLVQGGEARAKQILQSHREELDRLANALIEFETLSKDEIVDIMAGHPISR